MQGNPFDSLELGLASPIEQQQQHGQQQNGQHTPLPLNVQTSFGSGIFDVAAASGSAPVSSSTGCSADPSLHTPTPTQELPNPLDPSHSQSFAAYDAQSTPVPQQQQQLQHSGFHNGSNPVQQHAQQSLFNQQQQQPYQIQQTSMFQAQTPMPPQPSMQNGAVATSSIPSTTTMSTNSLPQLHTHRATPSLASNASTSSASAKTPGSTTSSSSSASSPHASTITAAGTERNHASYLPNGSSNGTESSSSSNYHFSNGTMPLHRVVNGNGSALESNRIHSSIGNHSNSNSSNGSSSSPASSNPSIPGSAGLLAQTMENMQNSHMERQQQQQQQQQQQMAVQNNHNPTQDSRPQTHTSLHRLTQDAMKWAHGTELAVRAAEDLATSYNKISGILNQGVAIEMSERLEIRQEFVAAVAALDKAFFLSPAGPGYIGMQVSESGGSRKRAYTVNSGDEGMDDPNKHRRTTSEAFSEASSILVSPRSATSSSVKSSRPPLFHHTHSSPLLPVDSHYRPTSAGISDITPGPKAADLAASGSHAVGRLSNHHQPTHLSQSMLASDEVMHTDDAAAYHSPPNQNQNEQQQQQGNGFVINQIQPQQQQTQQQQQQLPILSPIPQLPNLSQATHLDLATMQLSQQQQQSNISLLPSHLSQQAPLDPQAYAQQALRTQDLLLAQAGSTLEPAFEPLIQQEIPVSQSSTPTPYQQQQAYITPPMVSVAQFQQQPQQQHVSMSNMGYGSGLDIDMDVSASTGQDQQQQAGAGAHISGTHTPAIPLSLPQQYQDGIQMNRAMRPGQLDFTTLRGDYHGTSNSSVKDEMFDSCITSPYASSQVSSSFSSFPFTSTTNSGTSATSASESRSRATSFSRNTSASRSRAQSINSVAGGGNPYSFAMPDADELGHILGSLTTLPSPINEDDDDFESFYENQSNFHMSDSVSSLSSTRAGAASTANAAGAVGVAAAGKDKDALPSELEATLNELFMRWLPAICADVEATDRKGEKIHQPLMAKRMAKFDEEHAFRPFKFRIQPFTNGFQDACKDAGMSEADAAVKNIKNYLWNQPLISRFNDEGKKSKSRGNHVWSVEARYIDVGQYEFRPPPPKIVPIPIPASPGQQWVWQPKVLDSQCQGQPMDADFFCTNLPSWLDWRAGILSGYPPEDARSLSLEIIAEYAGNKLTQIFTIPVVANDGVRGMSSDAIIPGPDALSSTYGSHMLKPSQPLHASTSSSGSDLTASTASIATPPSYLGQAVNSASLLPSAMPAMGGLGGPDGMPGISSGVKGPPAFPKLQTSQLQTSASIRSGPSSPISPQQSSFASHVQQHAAAIAHPHLQAQPPPFFLPTSQTDVTTLASASHIKAKLVETTTTHHENLAVLNPAHPPADPHKVSAAVDAAISHQLAYTAAHPQMPSATEVFNATLEVSTRSQQMQQDQLTQVVAAVSQQIQVQQQIQSQQMQQPMHQHQMPAQLQHHQMQQQLQHMSASGQVTSQLADFSFTPCNTPGNRSPETSFQSRMGP